MKWFSSIRAKLLLCFLVFILLFNIVSIAIYMSSNRLTNEYDTSFERFLLYNDVSQHANELYEHTRAYVSERGEEQLNAYFEKRADIKWNVERLRAEQGEEAFHLSTYISLIETHVQNSEITIGFVLREDVEGYTAFLQETQNTAVYIQEDTLGLIDFGLTEYQSMYRDLQSRNEAFRTFAVFLFATTACLAILAAFWFSGGIHKPVQALSSAAKEVSKGNFSGTPVKIESNDEMKLLGDAFNRMRTDINAYVEEMKEKAEMSRLMNELEFKHLQNQMNPHFLFNTLNTVSKMAYLENAHTTSELMDSVSRLLRYNLGSADKAVPLKDEVDVVRSYFHIQQTRFQERIDFQIEMEEEALDVNVPRLVLQPLVENACIHGVESLEEGGTITLRIFTQGPYTIVEVADNGIGMTQKQVEAVFARSVEEAAHVGHSTQIGMANVRRRLQLFYQQEHLFDVRSTLREGTVIRLYLPNEQENEESA
ncbi:sensor histidine kinase [Shouchella shacheensis]|uniref:sensor histidine kinase n=1 Tax=Shouchella shacheensis TaxID=1649580 RepID=UPI0007402A62|nr:sensor histidine kinase [Shouchella shacheensis]